MIVDTTEQCVARIFMYLLLGMNSPHYSGGPTCGVIPALSLLMDASKRNCLAAHWYQNFQSCLIPGMLVICGIMYSHTFCV